MGSEPTLRMIWGIAKSQELQLTDVELHDLVFGITGKESMRKLTVREMGKVVGKLQAMKDSAKKSSRRGNMATARQRKKIYRLQEELGWDDCRTNGMVERMFKVKRLEWLDEGQCSKLIEALKAMLERKEAEKSADGCDTGTEALP